MLYFIILIALIQEIQSQSGSIFVSSTSTLTATVGAKFTSTLPQITNFGFNFYNASLFLINKLTPITLAENKTYNTGIGGLSASTHYIVEFYYNNGTDQSIFGDVYTAPENPSFSISTITSTSVMVNFVSSGLTTLEVCLFVTMSESCTYTTETSSKTFTNLISSGNYTLNVQAVFQGSYSDVISMDKIYTDPSPPILGIVSVTYDTIRVSAMENSTADYLKTCIFPIGEGPCLYIATVNSNTFSGLNASRIYSVQGVAVFQNQESSPAVLLSVYTAPTSPTATVTAQVNNTLTVSFNETSNTTAFNVCIHLSNGSCTPTAATSPTVFEDLIHSGNYTVEIIGVFNNAESTPAIIAPVYTAPAMPSIAIVNETDSNIRVQFIQNSLTDSFKSCIYQSGTSPCDPVSESSPKVFAKNSTQTYIIRLVAVYQMIESVVAEKSTVEETVATTTEATSSSSLQKFTGWIFLLEFLLFLTRC